MTTLVIHPTDPTTDFLNPIYSGIKDKDLTLVTGKISKAQLNILIKNHDTIICLGHGLFDGLFSMGKFKNLGYSDYIIDRTTVPFLKGKKIVSIWCYAKVFIKKVGLTNVYTSDMFCSDIVECILMDVNDATEEMVEESNNVFGITLGKLIHLTPQEIDKAMRISDYAELAKTNIVAAYNMERLSYV